MITINLEDVFEPEAVSEDLSQFIFESELMDGSKVILKMKIVFLEDPLLPNVYNLAFGPPDGDAINDHIKLKHKNTNKVFSSIILYAITYLKQYPDRIIGIDGSNDTRAYLYHRMFATNYGYLKDILITIGLDWYVRLLRNGTIEVDNEDLPFFKPKPEPFDLLRKTDDLYRYYTIQLNE